ncbi:MAG: Rpn family recombination-promoting nuclease/putative transposase [Candidatus Sericytochromatia bacterium]
MIKKIHDYGYKKLFSNKTIFKQLMQTFVNESWVNDIDYENTKALDKSFISENYKNTEGDLIIETKLNNKDFYVYILLEFQSSVDKFMSLRILNYITNFYMDLLNNNKELKELSPVFPMMLYNGDDKWTAPINISELIQENELLGEYKLNFKYFKLAENDFKSEDLLKIKNIVSTLFLAEVEYDLELITNEMLNLFEKEEDKQAVSIFLNWFRILSKNGKIVEEDYKEMESLYKDKGEVSSMLVTAINNEKQKLINIGRNEEKIELITNMYKKGFNFELISDIANISIDKIKEILKLI